MATFYRLVSPIDLSTPDSHANSLTFWLNDTVIMKKVRVRIMLVSLGTMEAAQSCNKRDDAKAGARNWGS